VDAEGNTVPLVGGGVRMCGGYRRAGGSQLIVGECLR